MEIFPFYKHANFDSIPLQPLLILLLQAVSQSAAEFLSVIC